MACVIRFYGDAADVDELQRLCPTDPCAVFRKGVARSNRPGASVGQTSGVNLVASDADFDCLELQQRETLSYLRQHHSALVDMRKVTGVEFANVDFGICMRNVIVQCDVFEVELLAELSNIKLCLELTQYPPDGKAKRAKQYRRMLREKVRAVVAGPRIRR